MEKLMRSFLKQEEIKYRLRSMVSPLTKLSDFFLCNNDQELINRINNNDPNALLQFVIKHLSVLTKQVINRGLFYGIEKEVIDKNLPIFFENVKYFATQYSEKQIPEDWMYRGKYLRNFKIDYKLIESLIEQKYQKWRNLIITDNHINFLNKLNKLLIQTEEEIVARAKIDLPIWEAKLKNENSGTSDYEYFVEISYFTDISKCDYVYKANHTFDSHNLKNNDWGLLCDGKDWRESGWLPILEKRCCYLMHELIYHAGLQHMIFEINDIWVETKTWDQLLISFEAGVWKTVDNNY